ncbi:MAG: NUDIX domain-containing protein [Armatimonadota bacterium]|nr:MAG: NUDIX domain-containing protein [Armatimonadota bacterium]
MPRVRHVVLAYITHADRLLVFAHPDFPEAGIQVPGGAVKEGEKPDEAIMREAFEETGLEGLELQSYLGDHDVYVEARDEVYHCRFYHLTYHGCPPVRWRHDETDPADGSPGPITFEFFWVRLPDEVPALSGEQDAMLPELLDSLPPE